MQYSEDEQLEAVRRSEVLLATMHATRSTEARWIYHRIIEIAVRPYACVVIGAVAPLIAQCVLVMKCDLWAGAPMCFCLVLGGVTTGLTIAWRWNAYWYALLGLVFDERPDLFEVISTLAQDDPAIGRPMIAFRARTQRLNDALEASRRMHA